MLVIPAIDLRGGRCVRLLQGDYERETVFGDDPVEVARRWQAAGARMIHVVDLDGARTGLPSQREIIGEIASAVDVPVQVGGGVRTVEDAAALLGGGVERVIIGTAAVKNPAIVTELIDRFGAGRVVAGIDARATDGPWTFATDGPWTFGGLVATDGWRETSVVAAADLIADMWMRGVERVVYTDIERDGTLTAPNFDAIAAAAQIGPAIIASGGVARREHLDRLAGIAGIEAAIVGRAIYTGDLVLAGHDWVVTLTEASTGGTG